MIRRMMKRMIVFVIVILGFTFGAAFSADIVSLEREAQVLRVNLRGADSPSEKEAILRKIIDTCKGTEEAEAAYWDLADLYLNDFPSERRREAAEMLELCLRTYPNSNRSTMIKLRLIDLYDAKNKRRTELINQLKSDKNVPEMMRSSLN